MNIINVSVYDKVVEIEGTPVIICGNGDYRLDVTFGSDWKASSGVDVKVARFMFNSEGERKFIDVVMEGDRVAVPVLSNIKEVYVGFYTDTLVTSTPGRILCEKSIKCADAVVKSNGTAIEELIKGTIQRVDSAAEGARDYVLYGCSDLTVASFPNATYIGKSAFESCSALISINAPLAINIGISAFNGCSALQLLNLTQVKVIDMNAFYGCGQLTKVKFPQVETIGSSAFRYCTALTSVCLPKISRLYESAFGLAPVAKAVIGTESTNVCIGGSTSMAQGRFFDGSPFIYVPNSLVEHYRISAYWNDHANQIFPWVSSIENLYNVDTTLYTRACVGYTNGGTEYIHNGTSWEVAQ